MQTSLATWTVSRTAARLARGLRHRQKSAVPLAASVPVGLDIQEESVACGAAGGGGGNI